MSESSLTYSALLFGPQDRGLVQVSMKDVSLWRLSGLNISGLKFSWPGSKISPPMNIDLEKLKGRVGIFSLLTGARNIHVLSNLYGGDLDAEIGYKKNTLRSVDITLNKLNLKKMNFLESLSGSPLSGEINLTVDLVSILDLKKDGHGNIKFNFENLSFGPGTINLPMGSMVPSLTVPKIILGKLLADISLDKGELSTKTFTLRGGDLEADLKLSFTFGDRPEASHLEGQGWFSLKPELIKSNETLKMLYDLIPELKNAEQNQGRVGFAINGNIIRPQFRLEAYQAE